MFLEFAPHQGLILCTSQPLLNLSQLIFQCDATFHVHKSEEGPRVNKRSARSAESLGTIPCRPQRSKQNSQLCNESMLKHLAVQTSSTSGSANSSKNICHTALWPKTMACGSASRARSVSNFYNLSVCCCDCAVSLTPTWPCHSTKAAQKMRSHKSQQCGRGGTLSSGCKIFLKKKKGEREKLKAKKKTEEGEGGGWVEKRKTRRATWLRVLITTHLHTQTEEPVYTHTYWLNNVVFICVLDRTGPYEFVNDRQRKKTFMIHLKNCKFTFTSYVI